MKLHEGLSALRELISRSSTPEGFEALPATLEKVLTRLEEPELHPSFRADIYDLLLGTTQLCEQLSEPTYDATSAARLCSRLHEVLARINIHLSMRTANRAFGILFPRTNTLHEDICASEEEAVAKLEGLRRIGLRENGEVVEVTITSQRISRPRMPPAPKLDSEMLAELEGKLEEKMK